MDDRCSNCDRAECPKLQHGTAPHSGHLDIDDPGDCVSCAAISACMRNAVLWRERALKAEAALERGKKTSSVARPCCTCENGIFIQTCVLCREMVIGGPEAVWLDAHPEALAAIRAYFADKTKGVT